MDRSQPGAQMELAEFEKLVQEGFERLPVHIREKIKNVALLVEAEPSPAVRAQEHLNEGETLLGYYQGVPLTAREYGMSMTPPDTITLYQKPIEQAAREDGMDVRTVIAETIWHEYAHHFGMDEDEVQKREGLRP